MMPQGSPHQPKTKLSKVYGELLERPEGDPDTLVVSETSRNFMSKLRIGVMLDGGPEGRQVRALLGVGECGPEVELLGAGQLDVGPAHVHEVSGEC